MSTTVRSQQFRARRMPVECPWRATQLLAESRWTRTFRAHSPENPAGDFAVKTTQADLTTDRDRDLALGLLMREAAVSDRVRQRNLAATLDVIRADAGVWLLQPLPGKALPEAGEISLSTRLWIIRQTAQALAALHAGQWLHGNVSAEAIFLGSAGHATLGELGWCRQLGTDECNLGGTPFIGQIRSAAPEMFDDVGMLTPAADIYSLGVVLVELLTGSPLLGEYDGPALVAAKRLLAAPQIADDQVPYDVAALATRMLSRDPLRRPTAREVIDTLIAAEIASFAHSFSPR